RKKPACVRAKARVTRTHALAAVFRRTPVTSTLPDEADHSLPRRTGPSPPRRSSRPPSAAGPIVIVGAIDQSTRIRGYSEVPVPTIVTEVAGRGKVPADR